MFKKIAHISDVQPFVAHKKEIRFLPQPNGVTFGCYLFKDAKTFDVAEALECRGIAFDREGRLISRPLHKFFNLGENADLTLERVLARDDIVAVYDKLDGSMIATAWMDDQLLWRSKKSFDSDVVRLTKTFLASPSNENILTFASKVANSGMTANFELTHPKARIVVSHDAPALRLLHVRDNLTGAYVMLDPSHEIHELIREYNVPLVPRFENFSLSEAMVSLDAMQSREGFVVQFANGDMVKLKCPWYLRLHRGLTLLRERDIAKLALNENLDDFKNLLAEVDFDLSQVEEVETRLKNILSDLMDEVEAIYQKGHHLDRKNYAIANKSHPLFTLAMRRYLGEDLRLAEWYEKGRLKNDFNLRMLVGGALAEAIEG